jgi:hypothetical protein
VLAEAAAAGAPPEGWLAVGDGAVRYRGHLDAHAATVPPDSSPLHAISGAAICELAVAGTPAPDRQVLPDYRRRPDAEIALESAAAASPDAQALSAGRR